MPRQHTEHQHQCALIQWAEGKAKRYPEVGMLFAIPNGGARHIAVARKLKAEGVRAGVPDLFLPVPRGGYGGLFIEMKSPKGKVTKEQAWWEQKLVMYNFHHETCFNWVEAALIICAYLGIPHTELDHAA